MLDKDLNESSYKLEDYYYDDTIPKKKKSSFIIYLAPFVILAIGVFYYFDVFAFLWDTPLGKVLSNIVVISILFISFVVSLFFVGKHIQESRPDVNPVSILKGKQAYYIVLEIASALELLMDKEENAQLKPLVEKVKRLEERLKIETDFGYGNRSVIHLENDISTYLINIKKQLSNLEASDAVSISEIENHVLKINELLHRRTELKRR
ncbi:hypothetical protein [Oceanobacillus sp. Castelsardo]|uniref:hypothetical protein n=1 Tax=Oceanobacillus sp. Castelsardo TaxID=1851204 RepID=UPI000837D2F0|nr:hypothetical protein [Oceanobacillus sp. Castelsardo]